jgi:hypothetical protein
MEYRPKVRNMGNPMKEGAIVPKILRKAARLLNNKTWIQMARAIDKDGFMVHPSRDDTVGFCASGAIQHVVWKEQICSAHHWWTVSRAYQAVHACEWEILQIYGPEWHSLELWNDDKNRTVKEVCRLLRLTANHLEGKLYYGK